MVLQMNLRLASVLGFSALALGNACASAALPAGEGISVTAGGETLALNGFPFPPANAASDVYFVDGWEVKLAHVYATFDNVTLSESPDKSVADQSQTGAAVAKAIGPWAVDLSKGGPLRGKGGDDQAVFITDVPNQNLRGGAAFAADTKYAFGYDVVAASAGSKRINLDSQDEANYAEMVQKGYVVFYTGTATFRGTDCSGTANATLASLPKEVNFRFGFKSPSTYINCQNPDLGESAEGNPRGIQLKTNEKTVAQMTIHADHPFWNAVKEDAPLQFDPFAYVAKIKAKGTLASPLTFEDLDGVQYAPIKIGADVLIKRGCAPASKPTSDQELILEASGGSYADMASLFTANQVTQGHLNADGLCARR